MSAMVPRRAEVRQAPPSSPLPLGEGPGVRAGPHNQFVVSFGKIGALGVFASDEPMALVRGQKVIVKTTRGIELGAVLCPASIRQARLLGATSSGELLRAADAIDLTQRGVSSGLEHSIFETSRAWAQRDGLALEVLDVDLMFDGTQAIIQFVGSDADTDKLALALEQHFKIAIRLESLATPKTEEEHEHGGCDKPDCGREAGGSGGCTTCSTGGGCSTCGSGKTDLKEYFGHLRTKMETRIPLA